MDAGLLVQFVLFSFVLFTFQWYPVHSNGAMSGVEFLRSDIVDDDRHDLIEYIADRLYTVNATNASQHGHHLLAPVS